MKAAKLFLHRNGKILQLTSLGFVALMKDQLNPERPEDTEEFMLDEVSDSDRPLVKVGVNFQYKGGYRRSGEGGGVYRAWWLEFEGSTLKW